MEKISENDNSDIDLNDENSSANLNDLNNQQQVKKNQSMQSSVLSNREATRSDKDIFETKKGREERKGKRRYISAIHQHHNSLLR